MDYIVSLFTLSLTLSLLFLLFLFLVFLPPFDVSPSLAPPFFSFVLFGWWFDHCGNKWWSSASRMTVGHDGDGIVDYRVFNCGYGLRSDRDFRSIMGL